MSSVVALILYPLLALVAVSVLTIRLRLFRSEPLAGRAPLIGGLVFLVLGVVWAAVTTTEAYAGWFVESAYPVFRWVVWICFGLATGALLTGLLRYIESLREREHGLSESSERAHALAALADAAGEPYPLIELLTIACRTLASSYVDSAAAVCLVDRSRRVFVLTASAGLARDEMARLEQFPQGPNLLTQSMEERRPLIASRLDLSGRGETIDLPHSSYLSLPLTTAQDPVGVVLLLSRQPGAFAREHLLALRPVCDWLGERIANSRLARELAGYKRQSDAYADRMRRLTSVLGDVSRVLAESGSVEDLCEAAREFVRCDRCFVLTNSGGELRVMAGHGDAGQWSESFRTAMIRALDRDKPIIINQEGADGTTVGMSTLVAPFTDDGTSYALVFVRDGDSIDLSRERLSELDLLVRLTRSAVHQESLASSSISRRRGMEQILRLLTARVESPTQTWRELLDALGEALPGGSTCAVISLQADRLAVPAAADPALLHMSSATGTVERAEWIVGALRSGESRVVSGHRRIAELLAAQGSVPRLLAQHLGGKDRLPDIIAVVPVRAGVDVIEGVLAIVSGTDDTEHEEWLRLIELAAGIIGVRLAVLQAAAGRSADTPRETDTAVQEIRSILTDESLRPQTRDVMEKLLRRLDSKSTAVAPGDSTQPVGPADLIRSALAAVRISDNLYMIGGRAREIGLDIETIPPVRLAAEKFQELFEEAVNRFGALAADDETISLSVYRLGRFAYLDICRHHRDFPPVRRVAEFGSFRRPDESLQHRPSDTYLRHLSSESGDYSFDQHSSSPTYLSFRFRLASEGVLASTPRILAVDDQQVILDLIQAMCQTSGYEVGTASSGAEGLQTLRSQAYDIVLTDLAMPGMSGLEFAREVRQIYPDLPIILLTGWQVNISPDELAAAGISTTLSKPFQIEQLTDALAGLIPVSR